MDKVEFAWNAYAILKRRDLEGFLALVDPEVEFRSLIAEAEGRGYRGHEGVQSIEIAKTIAKKKIGAQASTNP